MRIGQIVKSNTHVDYVCQIDNPGEFTSAPAPEDYAFGTFVRVALNVGPDREAPGSYLVGLIYSTILMNPEFGSLGPRLSPPADLEVFSPDYLREQATLVGIVAVGQVSPADRYQGVPRLAAAVGAEVATMAAQDVRSFHFRLSGPGLSLAYAPLLLAQGDPLIPHLLLSVVNRLDDLFPDQARQLAVLRGNLAWKSAVTPVG
jgi:hypothetical protein